MSLETIIGAVILWIVTITGYFINKELERRQALLKEQLQWYQDVLSSLLGFYKGNPNSKELMEKFSYGYVKAWAYAPDEIIKEMNKFILEVKKEEGINIQQSPDKKRIAMAKLLLTIRRKFIKNTGLNQDDYYVFSPYF